LGEEIVLLNFNNFLNMLEMLVNPWTILVFIIILLFRKSINKLISNLGTLDFNFKDIIAISAIFNDSTINEVLEMDLNNIKGLIGKDIEINNTDFNNVKNILKNKESKYGIANLYSLFKNSNSTLVPINSEYDQILKEMEKIGLVSFVRELKVGIFRNRSTQWQIYKKGIFLLEILKTKIK